MDKITLKMVLEYGRKILEEAEIEEAVLDSWYLMEYYFKIRKTDYLMDPDREVTQIQVEEYSDLAKKRGGHIPLQYITGTQEFMGLEFDVSPHVLIPRQDTEILVEEVMKGAQEKEILDLCTGSGCIIISLAKLCSLKRAVGVDISEEALQVARHNVEKQQVHVTMVKSDLFGEITGKFDRIVSNPPYIPSREIEGLMPEVRVYEPRLALDGKEDGLYFYRQIINRAKEYLKPQGELYFEIGYNQGDKLFCLLQDAGFKQIKVLKDLAGLDRVVKAELS